MDQEDGKALTASPSPRPEGERPGAVPASPLSRPLPQGREVEPNRWSPMQAARGWLIWVDIDAGPGRGAFHPPPEPIMSRFPRRVSARFVVPCCLPACCRCRRCMRRPGRAPATCRRTRSMRASRRRNAYGAGDYDTSIAALETVLASCACARATPTSAGCRRRRRAGRRAARGRAAAAGRRRHRAERRYTHGDEQLQLTITGESALLQGLGAVFDNPAALGSGPRIERLDGRRARCTTRPATRCACWSAMTRSSSRRAAMPPVSEATLQAFLRRVDFDTIENPCAEAGRARGLYAAAPSAPDFHGVRP